MNSKMFDRVLAQYVYLEALNWRYVRSGRTYVLDACVSCPLQDSHGGEDGEELGVDARLLCVEADVDLVTLARHGLGHRAAEVLQPVLLIRLSVEDLGDKKARKFKCEICFYFL